MIKQYKKKPVVIEAVMWDGENDIEIMEWDEQVHKGVGRIGMQGDNLVIRTLEGFIQATKGDYIIRGVQNEIYPCKPDIFEQTYEPLQ